METLILSNELIKTETVKVPDSYVLPPELRPANVKLACDAVPVIDLAHAEADGTLADQVSKAGKEFGCFQIINHGVAEKLMSDLMAAANEFFLLPAEDKAEFYSEDPNKLPLLSSGIAYKSIDKLYWRDYLRLNCYPVEEFIKDFPQKPANFRESIAGFSAEARELTTRLLELICRGIGVDEDYLDKTLRGAAVKMLVNHYPPCPDPSLTLGLHKHVDSTVITLLLQGDVAGLQVLHKGEWIQVEPLPNAIVVLYGLPLEFLTNGVLRSVEHRAVTNESAARTTVGMFFSPKNDCQISPAESLITGDTARRLYRTCDFSELKKAYLVAANDREKTLEAFVV